MSTGAAAAKFEVICQRFLKQLFDSITVRAEYPSDAGSLQLGTAATSCPSEVLPIALSITSIQPHTTELWLH